ncbi:hypothetical protein B0I35DRAFT_403844 [Stachybotrys elegans]|uniref:Uncharacterized protein n=1 Tax=Stachybotrys elegans TaxID=80388 RepID=A0A8K0WY39_9HYPO|nr:hypothetical protein B0I35DRAFT_403844 [Stachybotrys elegans]
MDQGLSSCFLPLMAGGIDGGVDHSGLWTYGGWWAQKMRAKIWTHRKSSLFDLGLTARGKADDYDDDDYDDDDYDDGAMPCLYPRGRDSPHDVLRRRQPCLQGPPH